jgi:hypothetical protein
MASSPVLRPRCGSKEARALSASGVPPWFSSRPRGGTRSGSVDRRRPTQAVPPRRRHRPRRDQARRAERACRQGPDPAPVGLGGSVPRAPLGHRVRGRVGLLVVPAAGRRRRGGPRRARDPGGQSAGAGLGALPEERSQRRPLHRHRCPAPPGAACSAGRQLHGDPADAGDAPPRPRVASHPDGLSAPRSARRPHSRWVFGPVVGQEGGGAASLGQTERRCDRRAQGPGPRASRRPPPPRRWHRRGEEAHRRGH